MKIGITTHNLNNKDFQEQLFSMLKHDVKPDFIIVHYAGIFKIIKYLRFFKKTVKQYRFKSLHFFFNFGKKKNSQSNYSLASEEIITVNNFIKSCRIIKTNGINDASTIKRIKNLGESIIVCNSGILKARGLALPNVIFLNIHSSKLPEYRGMNNIEWTLWDNKEIYVTIHKISKAIDEGDILYQEKIETEIVFLASIQNYRDYCFFKSNEIIGKAINRYVNNGLRFLGQENKGNLLSQYYTMHPILKNILNQKLG